LLLVHRLDCSEAEGTNHGFEAGSGSSDDACHNVALVYELDGQQSKADLKRFTIASMVRDTCMAMRILVESKLDCSFKDVLTGNSDDPPVAVSNLPNILPSNTRSDANLFVKFRRGILVIFVESGISGTEYVYLDKDGRNYIYFLIIVLVLASPIRFTTHVLLKYDTPLFFLTTQTIEDVDWFKTVFLQVVPTPPPFHMHDQLVQPNLILHNHSALFCVF
jgi:hypothetical protein